MQIKAWKKLLASMPELLPTAQHACSCKPANTCYNSAIPLRTPGMGQVLVAQALQAIHSSCHCCGAALVWTRSSSADSSIILRGEAAIPASPAGLGCPDPQLLHSLQHQLTLLPHELSALLLLWWWPGAAAGIRLPGPAQQTNAEPGGRSHPFKISKQQRTVHEGDQQHCQARHTTAELGLPPRPRPSQHPLED